MAKYYLYKNAQIINVIEAEKSFIDSLINNGEIDNAVDESTLDNPLSLQYDAISHEFKEIEKESVIPQQFTTTTFEDLIADTKILTEKVNKLNDSVEYAVTAIKENIQNYKSNLSDIQSGFFAVKGFMMMLPDIKKTLDEIKTKLDS